MDNIKVSMTPFIDFTLRPDSQKPLKVREIKGFKYTVASDYWKQLRERIIMIHQKGYGPEYLEPVLKKVDKNRQDKYLRAIKEYPKFFKNRSFKWFNPPTGQWVYENLTINVNPELGLYINEEPHLIKLYFKEFTTSAEIQLNKSRAGAAAYLMWETLHDACPTGTKMAFLNVSKGQLVVPVLDKKDQRISLLGSVNNFKFYWENI